MTTIEDLVTLLRETVPEGGWRPLPVDPRADEWVRPAEAEWEMIAARAEGNDKESAAASNTRVWNAKHNLIGAFAEWIYGQLVGLPWNASTTLGDGGTDFPGVDVKGTPHWREPRLLRLATAPLKAPTYALIGIDLDERRGWYVGWATRDDLASAPCREYGYGPTRTLLASQLRQGFPPRADA